MVLDIKAMREKLENQSKKSNYGGSNLFSFKNLKVGDTVKIRLVEDGDPDAQYFWCPNSTRTLYFGSLRTSDGVIHTFENGGVYVTVPAFNLNKFDTCLDGLPDEYLFNVDEDVIQHEIRNFWGDASGSDLYRKYKKRMSYIYQGFIHSDGYEKNKLYRFIFSDSIHKMIKSCIEDDEIDSVPCDVEHGREFILKVGEKPVSINGVTSKAKDYSGSKWSSKECPLTEEERAVEKSNLKAFIFKKPTEEQLARMKEMYDCSINKQPYDVAKFAKFFKPNNIKLTASGLLAENSDSDSTESYEEPQVVPQVTPQVSQPKVETVASVDESGDDYIPNFSSNTEEKPQQFTKDELLKMLSQIDNNETPKESSQQATISVSGDSLEDIVSGIMNKLK